MSYQEVVKTIGSGILNFVFRVFMGLAIWVFICLAFTMGFVSMVQNIPPPDIKVETVIEETFTVQSQTIIDETGLVRYLVESNKDQSIRYAISSTFFKKGDEVSLVDVSIKNGLETDTFYAVVSKK